MLWEEDIKARADFRACIESVLKVVECSCTPRKCKDFLLHQMELLHMLSGCTGELVRTVSLLTPSLICGCLPYRKPCQRTSGSLCCSWHSLPFLGDAFTSLYSPQAWICWVPLPHPLPSGMSLVPLQSGRRWVA